MVESSRESGGIDSGGIESGGIDSGWLVPSWENDTLLCIRLTCLTLAIASEEREVL